MQLDDQSDAPSREAGEQPQLPERPRGVEVRRANLLERVEELALAGAGLERPQPDVMRYVERARVGPERDAEAPGRLLHRLPESRDAMDPATDGLADALQEERAVGIA